MMTRFDKFKNVMTQYLSRADLEICIDTTLHEASKNDQNSKQPFLYNGEIDLPVISMDAISQEGYRVIKNVSSGIKNSLNTVDAFLIGNMKDAIKADESYEWYFIEFKDCRISKKKDNIEKKGMANWLMLQDIFYEVGSDICGDVFDFGNPCKFAREHLVYILVCSSEKDPYTYEQVRNKDKIGMRYTPECLEKFKNYFFKDAYAYTEQYFENRFVKKFAY